ncbi:MAG TPA: carboxypeptidase-like regulatory domain-containing protein [Terriglobales bacterium]|nr:carboxypeptidase-like regulatory domain-containing protein [Terriglobales bacterium]
MLDLRKPSPIFASMFLLFASVLWAQKDTGGIAGIVTDPSGAVVGGAKVTVTDVDRGISLTTTTNSNGEYVVRPLKVGRYNVTVELKGFKRTEVGPVTVDVQSRPQVNGRGCWRAYFSAVQICLRVARSCEPFLTAGRQAEPQPEMY